MHVVEHPIFNTSVRFGFKVIYYLTNMFPLDEILTFGASQLSFTIF